MTDASKGILNLEDTAREVLLELAVNLSENPEIDSYGLTIVDEQGNTYDLLIGLDFKEGKVIEFSKDFIH